MQTLKIALIGEGKNDIGIEARDGSWSEGAVQPILRKFIPNADFQPLAAKKDKKNFRTPGNKTPRFQGSMLKLRALWPILIQKRAEFGLLIFYHDLDKRESGKGTATTAKKTFREAQTNAELATEEIQMRLGFELVPMIPMRMLENWLLADEEAFEESFGSVPKGPKLPTKPESIWGNDKDPDSDHPKSYLNRVLHQFSEVSHTENFVLIAESSQVAALKQKCPISFVPFAEKMEAFAAKHA